MSVLEQEESLSFPMFMQEVDILLYELTGMFSCDFPDWTWHEAYESCVPVEQVVQEFLQDMEEWTP